jgi:hypothetical protein
MFKKQIDSRSPLKDRPLRLPGQSVQDEIDDILDDEFLHAILIATVFIIIAMYDWIYALFNAPRNPWVTTLICCIALGYSINKGYRAYKKILPLKLGRDGERIVAEQHDIVADGFNIDHVIITKQGIFVAETKTRSKPTKGSPKVTYDGTALLVDGFKPDRDPIAQAEMNAQWIGKELEKSSGKRFSVKPVVLFPGWWVENSAKNAKVWVLEPKQLPGFVRHEQDRLSEPDLYLASYHLTRIVRS